MAGAERHVILRWSLLCGLAVVLLGALPALALARPPADPVLLLTNTGAHGLAVVTDRRGRHLVLGGSEARTAATAALDRLLPPWDRRVGLLLVPAHLSGALEVVERRSVGQASLLGLAPRPHPVLDAWQARHPPAPVVGRAMIDLGADTRLWLDTGDDAVGGVALAVVERGPVRVLLLFGEAAPLAASRWTADALAAPIALARLTPAPYHRPIWQCRSRSPLTGVVPAGDDDGTRAIGLAAGEAVRLVLRPDRQSCRARHRTSVLEWHHDERLA